MTIPLSFIACKHCGIEFPVKHHKVFCSEKCREDFRKSKWYKIREDSTLKL